MVKRFIEVKPPLLLYEDHRRTKLLIMMFMGFKLVPSFVEESIMVVFGELITFEDSFDLRLQA